MNNLNLMVETYSNGYIVGVLDVLSIFAILCAIFVIISKNPIVSVLFLIGLFANISSYLIMIGLTFIGLSYLIVYIGAVSILFLFILMLINIRISELQSNSSSSIPLAIGIGICFNYPLFQILPYNIAILNNFNNYVNKILSFKSEYLNVKSNVTDCNDILFVSSKLWDGNLIENSHITSLGNVMYTNYNIWLIISSYILLLAMTGAIIITIKQK